MQPRTRACSPWSTLSSAGGRAAYLENERSDHTLQPTALVNEAWLRLIDQKRVEWKSQGHFMAVAAQAMRRILVDHARRKKSDKRGGDLDRVELHPDITPFEDEPPDLIAIDRGLDELREQSERMAKIVELRFFAGLQMEAVAQLLDISKSTVDREWRVARAWLRNFVKKYREEE